MGARDDASRGAGRAHRDRVARRGVGASLVLLGALAALEAGCPPSAVPEARSARDGGAPEASAPPLAPTPVAAPAPSPIVSFALGHGRGCAVRADGRVVCWGASPLLGDLRRAPPEEAQFVNNLDDALSVSGDDARWCALRRRGGVSCFADLGPARALAGASDVVELSGRCARRASGAVGCLDDDGVLLPAEGVAPARGVGGGPASSCAIGLDGGLACWGSNSFGELGDGTGRDSASAVPVKGVARVDEVSVGRGLVCARAGFEVTCWGGEGSVGKPQGRPRKKAGLGRVTQLAVGEYHACALRDDGTIACWGANLSGQLGVPRDLRAETDLDSSPMPVPGVADVEEVRVGGGEPCSGCGSTCVRRRGRPHELLCWGALAGEVGVRKTVPLTPGAATVAPASGPAPEVDRDR